MILTLSTGGVTAAHIGQRVTIGGGIVEVVRFSSGVKFYVDDGSGPVAVWIPQETFAQLPNPAGWIVGSKVRASGQVQTYKDELEVVPQAPGDMVVLVAATPQPVVITHMGDLSVDRKGERVTVQGAILEVRPFSSGVKYLLQDDTGQVVLLLWQDVHDAVPEVERLAVGAIVQAAGEVDEYRGELQVIPSWGGDVLIQEE